MTDLIFIWAAFWLAQLADVSTTRAALLDGHVEANPIMARLMGHAGHWFLIKLLIGVVAGAFLTWLGQGQWVLALAIFTGGIAANNWRIVRKGRRARR
jgi:hypothetical protein